MYLHLGFGWSICWCIWHEAQPAAEAAELFSHSIAVEANIAERAVFIPSRPVRLGETLPSLLR
jgi:hypothetical protein